MAKKEIPDDPKDKDKDKSKEQDKKPPQPPADDKDKKPSQPQPERKDSGKKKNGDKGQAPPPVVDPSTLSEHKFHEGEPHDDHGDHEHSDHEHHRHRFFAFDAAEAIYNQLVLTRQTLDKLVDETKEMKVRKQLDQLPVSVSDLMRGFQGAVSRANRAVQAGEGGEDIEQMMIKNLEISIDAPIINEAHAEDPMIMLPNENSGDSTQAKVSLKFSVVSVPKTQKQ